MAEFIKGTLTVAANATAQNLALGVIPSYFRMVNKTKLTATTNGVVIAEWWNDMPDATAYIWTTSAGDGTNKITYQATNGVTPYQTVDNQLFTPQLSPYITNASTNLVVTAITQAAQCVVTITNNPFTSSDAGVTAVTFHGVLGMTQINTLTGVVQAVSGNNVTFNINTTNFSAYTSGGIANVITGAPVTTLYGNQILNTSEANTGTIGLTLGSALMVTADDVWEYSAWLQAPFTGP